ncbi:MAG TPA: branched-chain amino acid ABC transporter permease [Candidatus Elarobacter sp.]
MKTAISRRWTIAIAAGLLIALVLPKAGIPTFFVSLLTQTWIITIAAMSLDLLIGFVGLVNFSQASLFGVGAYAVAIAATQHHITGFLPGLLLGIVAAVATAALFGLVALRAEGPGFIIITIALNEIVWGLAYQWTSVSGGDNGITGITRPAVGPFDVSSNSGYYYVCLAAFVLSFALLMLLVRSPYGLVLKGVRETPRRMRALGYNVWFYRYSAMLISAAFAGMAGVLYAWYNQFVGPVNLSLDQSTQFLIVTILGGIGTLYGQLFGALVVVFLSNELSAVTQRWMLVLGIVYFVVVMYAPGGLVVLVPRLWARLRGRRVAVVPTEPLLGAEEP